MERNRAPLPLVLGGGGMLGRALFRRIEVVHPQSIGATRAEIDITDRFRLEAEVERLRPTVIVNCAAFTDVDGCEVDADLARRVNAEGAENVARAAALAGCRLIHLSTDYVFDGTARRPYVEADGVSPISEYGRSKLRGEESVARACPDHAIVRSAWLYGEGRRNFVDTIRLRLTEGGVLRVVEDQVGSPTWVEDLAAAIERLITVDYRGVVHFANAGSCSRYEMALAIRDATGAHGTRLEPVGTDQAGRLARRPAYSALDTTLYTRLTGDRPRPWQEALAGYLQATAGRGAMDA